MALVSTTIRFSRTTHDLVSRMADEAGIPFSRYVREAALARAAYELGRSGGQTIRVEFDAILADLGEAGLDGEEIVGRVLTMIERAVSMRLGSG